MAIKKYFYINKNWKGLERKKTNTSNIFVVIKDELREFISNSYNYVDEC
jgi:hypothetical protein